MSLYLTQDQAQVCKAFQACADTNEILAKYDRSLSDTDPHIMANFWRHMQRNFAENQSHIDGAD